MRKWLAVALVALVAVVLVAGGSQAQDRIKSYSQFYIYSTSLTPSSMATTECSPSTTLCSTTETFAPITGLRTTDVVLLMPPVGTSHAHSDCFPIDADVSASNTLRIKFAKLTTAACTPVSGTYRIFVVRP